MSGSAMCQILGLQGKSMCRKTGENSVKSLRYCSLPLTEIGILQVHWKKEKVLPEMSDVHMIRFIRVLKHALNMFLLCISWFRSLLYYMTCRFNVTCPFCHFTLQIWMKNSSLISEAYMILDCVRNIYSPWGLNQQLLYPNAMI